MNQELRVTQSSEACEITFCQAEHGNLLTLAGLAQLAAAIRDAGRDPAVKLIRIRAQGASFCGGRAPSPPATEPLDAIGFRRRVADPILSVYRALHESEVPIMAQVQGDATGFGCALVAACDLAIAADTCRFSLPELRKNLPPTLVLSVLKNKVPPKAAAHMVYLTEPIDAVTARDYGLLGEVVTSVELNPRADQMAASICSRERVALTALKSYYREIYAPDFSLASDTAGLMLAAAMTSRGT